MDEFSQSECKRVAHRSDNNHFRLLKQIEYDDDIVVTFRIRPGFLELEAVLRLDRRTIASAVPRYLLVAYYTIIEITKGYFRTYFESGQGRKGRPTREGPFRSSPEAQRR